MLQTALRTVTMVTAVLLLSASSFADEKTKGSGEKIARDVLAQIAKGDPGPLSPRSQERWTMKTVVCGVSAPKPWHASAPRPAEQPRLSSRP